MRKIENKAGREVIKATVSEECGIVKVFFDYRLYKEAAEDTKKQEVVNRLRGFMAAGLISEFSLERYRDGEIVIYYNPLCHKIDELEQPLNKLILFINSCAEP